MAFAVFQERAVATAPVLQEELGLRPIGGPGSQVFRSRAVRGLGPDAMRALRGLELTSVYDLRKPKERFEKPDDPIGGEVFVAFDEDPQDDPGRPPQPVAASTDDEAGAPGERMRSIYRGMAHHLPLFESIVQGVARTPGNVLVHCASGKDRTGVLGALMLACVGADYRFIEQDYLLTNRINAKANARDLARFAGRVSPYRLSVLASLFEARPDYLKAFFSEAMALTGSETFGDFAATGIRVGAQDRLLLEQKLGL